MRTSRHETQDNRPVTTWKAAVEQVVTERGAALFGYAYVLTGDRHAADDLVQDALVRTFSKGKGGYSVDQAHIYVKRAIFTAFVDGRRRLRSRPATTAMVDEPPGALSTDALASTLSIHQAILSLPPRERACIVLRYLDDQPVAAVAQELGLATGTVKRYVSDAIARLRSTHPDLADLDDGLDGGQPHIAVIQRKASR